jgi:hypothetical protein
MFEERSKRVGAGVTERAEELHGLVVPRIEEAHKEALVDLITDAQKERIRDKEKFVNLVNESLAAMHLRIELPDGSLARLRVMPGSSGAGFIQFEVIGRGTRGGFASTEIKLVSYTDRRTR